MIKLDRQPGADTFEEMLDRLGTDPKNQNVRRFWILRWLEGHGIDVSDFRPAEKSLSTIPSIASRVSKNQPW